ncbi:hypothetical protein LCGC14_1452260 [marine sediment metagenome]|uniref:Uncharacterized protein n=1 Tax=marine sediment metagenome TaxID=412755 RepID=A0A0F9MJ87_9ZZZZ
MQFSTARAEVAAQTGLDETQSNTKTLINRWLNLSQLKIASAWNWSWLEDREIIVTEIDLTTGTVSVTAATATITFSDAPAASQANRFIQFSSADDWYEITAHTAASATATISPAYAQTTDLTAGTFIVRTFFYTFATTTEHVYNCKNSVDKKMIPIISATRYDKFEPFPDATANVPDTIILWKRDSVGSLQFTPFPWPDTATLLEFRIYKKPTDLSADTDIPLFPTKFDSLWILGAAKQGFMFLDDDREIRVRSEFNTVVKNLILHDAPAIDKSRQFKSIDQGIHRHGLIRFPSQFGEVHR